MLKNIFKIPFNYLGYYLNLPFVLPMSIAFAVAYRCNSRCKTCNIWKNFYEENELSLSEIDCLFHSLGNSFLWITLSGGEPFLREDFADICQIIYQNCHPAFINIPTNGSIPEEIVACVKKILDNCPKTQLTINLSIDGTEEKHDNIRGFPGNFDNVIKTYHGLRNLKIPRLRLGFYTVISNYNINDWHKIYLFCRELSPDSHFFEIAQIRDEFKNQDLNQIVPQKEDCIKFLKKLYNFNHTNKKELLEYLTHSLRKSYYSFVGKTLLLERRIIPCFAAFASVYILPDGKVWACSNNDQFLGDLKEYKFDFKKLWWSKPAQHIRKNIKEKKCFCLQVNTNYLNLIHSPLYSCKLICNY